MTKARLRGPSFVPLFPDTDVGSSAERTAFDLARRLDLVDTSSGRPVLMSITGTALVVHPT